MSATHEHRWSTEFDEDLQRKVDRCVICGVTRNHDPEEPDYMVSKA